MKRKIGLVIIVMLLVTAVGGQFTRVKAGNLNKGLQQWQNYLEQWEKKLENKAKGLQQWENYLVNWENKLKNKQKSSGQNDISTKEKKLQEKEKNLQQWENYLKKWEQRLDERENSDKRFTVSNISYKNYQYVDTTEVFGEIKNNFGKPLELANFKITFYDKEGNILDTASVGIRDWKSGYKKTFEAMINSQVKDKVARYKVQYDGGY